MGTYLNQILPPKRMKRFYDVDVLLNKHFYGNMLLPKTDGGKCMDKNSKPPCKLTGEDGNIFFILGRVRQTLKDHGKNDQAQEVSERVMASGSYDEALKIIMEYVDAK
jgi:hypothetical protein